MNVEEKIFTILSQDAGVAALVSNRIFPVEVPQDQSFPSIAYAIPEEDIQNHANGCTGTSNATVQISCFGETYLVVKALARAVVAALNAHFETGFNAFITNNEDGPKMRADGYNVPFLYSVDQTYSIWYSMP